jgi:hypothetical protein
MVVAIQIWLRLRASIPPSIRKYYSLIIDPAAGQVTVVARMPTLSSPGQWMASRPDVDKKSLDQESTTSFSWPPAVINAAPQKPLRLRKRARNHVTTRLASVISTRILTPFGMPPEVLMQSMTQAGRLGDITGGGKFAVTRSKLLHRPWMSLIEHCKLIMRPTDEMDDDQREEVRFTVQSDMKASDFTPLMMTWSHFAWICLALNVGAYDPLWQSSIPYTIKNGEGKDLIKLFEDNDRLCARLLSGQEVTYITHRALSWYNVAFNGEVLFPLGCGALSQVPISSVNISTELSAPSLPQKHARKARERAQIGVVRGKEPQECEHPLAAACYWMLYRRDFPAGWITVSQQMLEYRERVLCYLQHLDDHGMLLDRLVCIMTAGPRQNDALKLDDKKGAVSPPDATARPNLLKTSETSKEAHIDFVSDGSPVLQMSDKGEAAVDVSTHPTGKEGTTDPVQSADDRTNQLSAEFPKGAVATKQASAAFGVDREAMSYRDDDSAIRKARSDDADVNGEWRFRDRRRLAQPEIIKAHHVRVILRSHFESSAYVQRYQYLALMRQQLLPFISNKFMGGADHKTHSKEVLADSARDLLQPLEHSMPQHVHIQTQTNTYDSIDPKRRERFELAVRSYMIGAMKLETMKESFLLTLLWRWLTGPIVHTSHGCPSRSCNRWHGPVAPRWVTSRIARPIGIRALLKTAYMTPFIIRSDRWVASWTARPIRIRTLITRS